MVSSSSEGFLKVVKSEGGDSVYSVVNNAVFPIHLNGCILTINGWKGTHCTISNTYKKGDYTILEYIENRGVFHVCHGEDYHAISKIEYVHQLQHILFGLGLDSELKL